MCVRQVAELAKNLLGFSPLTGALQELSGVCQCAGDQVAVREVLCELSEVSFSCIVQTELLFDSSHRLKDERRDI